MADAPALGAGAAKAACRFDPDLAYQILRYANRSRHPVRRPDVVGRDDPDLADQEAQERLGPGSLSLPQDLAQGPD